MLQWPNSVSELSVHPHCEEERAGLYHAFDGGSAEVEVLEFLEALVRLLKPRAVLLTGLEQGYCALALASGLRSNGFGRLHAVEPNQQVAQGAAGRLADFRGFYLLHHCDSLQFLEAHDGPPFELCVFDGPLGRRADEYNHCERYGLLAHEAVCVFHDTSELRGQGHDPAFVRFVAGLRDCHPGGLTCRYSRGLTMIQRR